ncbi:glycosyltransferase family 2 protein [Bacillus sp. 03113]|uniref:glycosyltransferase family 2 protein n=1 Tax=Bacillus sp. 03113 TaxID=2578211 RepID=UPI001143558B|nr:glycosyltransferase family 2 protein [Bacillus sp. 03113]
METNQKTAIILLNWNAYQDTFECLKSLELLNYSSFHIFLVDNDSQDDSFDLLKEDYRAGIFDLNISFIQSGSNLGFAGGNNVGIKAAIERGFEYFWLLNNDTIVEKNALDPLIAKMEQDNSIGIVGSKIFFHGSNKIWFAGGEINKKTGLIKHLGIGEDDDEKYNKSIEVDYITGCSLLIKRDVIQNVGVMKEEFFLYFEETDWNIRVKNNGYKIFYVPESIIWHKVSQSTLKGEKFSPIVFYYTIRNNIYLINNYFRKGTLTFFLFFSLIRILKNIIFNKSIIPAQYGFRAMKDGLANRMGKL